MSSSLNSFFSLLLAVVTMTVTMTWAYSSSASTGTGFNILSSVTRTSYPQVIGHAGASGYVPESSLPGYDMAANMLADYSEPDLVLTKDKYFIAMHDLTLEGTTNVLDFPNFKDRVSTFVIEGKAITGYYAINFTLSEIKTLRLRQRFGEGSDQRSSQYDWLFAPPTLQDIISWQISHYNATGRLVGIYPELKHPDWYNEMGYKMEDLLIEQLLAAGYHAKKGDSSTPRDLSAVVPVAIQCFKSPNLRYLSSITDIPLVQLIGTSSEYPTPDSVWSQAILDTISEYALAVGPDKKIFSTDWNTSVPRAIEMMSWANERNLFVVPWSFQTEAHYISLQFGGDARKELSFYYGCLQVAGVFHEFPDRAREVVDECIAASSSSSVKPSCPSLCPYDIF